MAYPPIPALLPAGLRDLLPPDALFEARLVASFVERVASHGYDLVKTPLVEFEETLLSGTGQSLARQTFRLMDPLSQQMMALRADITPQVARVAGSLLGRQPRPLRVAYAGEVLRVSGTQLHPERQFSQLGCELIGSDAAAADAEVILLAAEYLAAQGVEGISIDLTLPTFIPALLALHGLGGPTADELGAGIERRDLALVRRRAPALAPLVEELIAASGVAEHAMPALARLGLPDGMRAVLQPLEEVVAMLRRQAPELMLTVDPIERRGFEYHTGLSFTVFAARHGELGRGGRYRCGGIAGEPATGFTVLTDSLVRAAARPAEPGRVYLPLGTDPAIVHRLQEQGYVTVACLVGDDSQTAAAARDLGCRFVWNGELTSIETETV